MIEREGKLKITASTFGSEQIRDMTKSLDSWASSAMNVGEVGTKMSAVISGLSFAAWNQGLQMSIQLLGDAYRNLDDYSNLQMQFRGNINQLTAAVDNEISALDLMRGQNRLLMADVEVSDKQYADLAVAINKIAEATGKDGAQALDAFASSIERGSERGLKQLGVMVDLKEVYRQHAQELGTTSDKLTAAEKSQALFNASLEAVTNKAAGAREQVDTYTDSASKGLNKIKDKLLEIGALLNRGDMQGVMSVLWQGYVNVTDTAANVVMGNALDAGGIGQFQRAYNQGGKKDLQDIAASARWSKGQSDWESGVISDEAIQYAQTMRERLGKESVGPAEMGALEGGSPMSLGDYGVSTKLRRNENAKKSAKKKSSGKKKEPEIQAWEMDMQDIAAQDAIDMAEYEKQQKKDADAAEQLDKIRQQEKKVRDENTKLAKSMGVDLGKAAQFAGNDINKLNVYLTDLSDKTKQVDADMQGIAMGGLKKMAEGLVMSVDAAVSGSDSFGAAMAKMTQSALHNMTIEYGIKAVLAFGEALWMTATLNPGATVMYQAAAQFAVGAGMAGAGAALVGAGVSSGGTGSRTSAVKSRETAARGGSSTSSKSWGKKEENNQPITVNLYLGDKGDPSAALYMRKQIEAQIKKAA